MTVQKTAARETRSFGPLLGFYVRCVAHTARRSVMSTAFCGGLRETR